uniref:Uncharacterized protein n=1 Tax=Anguilla anguilla TaxID=7936 RepID=A0A0E9V6Y9_ANGAN
MSSILQKEKRYYICIHIFLIIGEKGFSEMYNNVILL